MILERIIEYMDSVSLLISLAGVAVITVAGAQALAIFIESLIREARRSRPDYDRIRAVFGEKILLGLEFFVAADIVRSIAAPTFTQLGQLASVVAIRIVLSYFLGRETKAYSKQSEESA